MPRAYLNIGSNQGDRRALIERAVALLAQVYHGCAVRLSDYIETEPWGYDSDNRYLNIGVAIDFDVMPQPLDMLHVTQDIERHLGGTPHRNADGSYRDREIDIDIIAMDGVRIAHGRLTVPHPRAAARDFVVIPLMQLTGMTSGQIIQGLLS